MEKNYSCKSHNQILKDLKIRVLLIVFGLFGVTGAYAQTKQITGTVIDNEGSLPGVNILVKGTSNGTVTDFDGAYVIEGVSSGDVLVFSSMGMLTKEIKVSNQSVIDITMVVDAAKLDEIVVVGYSTIKRKNLSSAVSQLDNKEISGLVVTDVKQAVQGKVAGVQVVSASGEPGSGSSITIRGMGSFSNSEPLYVIDGIQGGDLNSISQSDIASISILKDAATTAIYGSAGANGVVVVTTKKGKSGKVQVEYNGSVGISNVYTRMDMLTSAQYIDLAKDIQETNGLELTDHLKSDYVLTDRTDWQDEMFRQGMITDHNLSISGGTDDVTYSFTTGYQFNEGSMADKDFERINLGLKLNEKLFDGKLRLGQTIRFRQDEYNGTLVSLEQGLKYPQYLPVYDETNLGGYSRTDKLEDLMDSNNPLNSVGNTVYNEKMTSLDVDLYLELDLYDGLMYRSQARISSINANNNSWNYASETATGATAVSMNEHFNTFSSFFWENFLSYSKTIAENHDISATLGMSYAPAPNARTITGKGADYTSDAIQSLGLANDRIVTSARVNSGKSRLSYFASLGYIYKNKYIINSTFRRDASSVFGTENQWGNFYGLGGAWNISQEDFLKESSIISNLKLRASYGKTGNDNIPGGLTASSVWKGYSNNIVYTFGNSPDFSTGATVNSVPNPFLKWEETTQMDVGIDLGVFDNRLSFVLDYYQRNNEDLLINTFLPLSAGLGEPGANGTQWINAAAMKNRGVEFSVTYRNDRSNDFKWDITTNISYNKNEVTDLGTVGDSPVIAGKTKMGNTTRTDIGHALGAFYGYQVDHVAVDQAEVDKLNAGSETGEYSTGLKPGDFVFKDLDGNGLIDEDDRDYIGDPSPKWQYGATFNAEYKGFDFQIFLQGIADVEIVNASRYWTEGMTKPFNSSTNTLDRWRAEGDVASLPRAGQNPSTNFQFSDFFVEDGSYLRVKNITLGYTLPKNAFGKVFSKARFYVAAQNVLTFTNYSGYDPEIYTSQPNQQTYQTFGRGIDQYNLPNPTIYRLGVQLNF